MRLEEIIEGIIDSNETFISGLRKYMIEERMTTHDLSRESGIPESTLYKIMSNPLKDFRISTFRQIINGLRKISGDPEEDNGHRFIAIITSREALDTIGSTVRLGGLDYDVREFPSMTIEDEIIHGVQAERSGAIGILCGPVAASTLSRVVEVPVMSLRFDNDTIIKGLEKLSYKF